MPLSNVEMLFVILPEIGLAFLAGLLMIISMLKREKCNRMLGWITAVGIGLIAILAFIFSMPGEEAQSIWGGMLQLDAAGFVFRILFLVGAALTAVFSCTEDTIHCRPEFYIMLVFATLGMSLMASASDMIMLFLAIETASIPLYIMAGIKIKEMKSVEAGLKYFLFGSMSSAIMVYGLSLIYGFSGTTHYYEVAAQVAAQQVPLAGLVVAIVMVLAGFAFKISAAPFHFWAPDVYEGSPTAVTGFLSTASKAAGFAALLRILMILFNAEHSPVWQVLIAALAVSSMFIGNLIAIPQKNIKRLLAYSSIAQAGYILVGVAAADQLGFSGAIYYLMAYLVTNLAVFAVVGWIAQRTGSEDITAFAGLNKRAPGLAIAMLIGLLSLGGIPPFGGFFAKVLVFGAAIQSGLAWLAIIGVINSVIGLYYYLRLLKVMYVDEPVEKTPLIVHERLWFVALIVCLILVVVLGVVLTPWFGFSSWAAFSLY